VNEVIETKKYMNRQYCDLGLGKQKAPL